MKARMIEGRRKAAAARKDDKERFRPAQAERPPRRGAGILSDKLRRRVIDSVERIVGLLESSLAWGAVRLTRPLYKEEIGPDGATVVRVEIGRERAVSDETLAADRLEEWERKWLAEELTDELIRYPRLRGMLLRLVEFEDRSSLPICVTVLAIPRLANHGLIPAEFIALVGEMREAARKAHHGQPRAVSEPAPEITSAPSVAAAD